MKTLKAILIDDEELGRTSLSNLLKTYCSNIEICAMCHDIDDAYQAINKHNPDLIFLDVNIPPHTGFDLLKRFDKINFEVIIVTAFDHYAIEAIRFSAIDYLLKPVRIDELQAAIARADARILQHQKMNYNLVSQVLETQHKPDKLIIHTHNGSHLIMLSNLIYIQSDNTYSIFHTTQNEKIVSSKSIKNYEEMLSDKGFFRSHKSYLINMKYVKSLLQIDQLEILLSTTQKVPLAHRRKDAFLEHLKN